MLDLIEKRLEICRENIDLVTRQILQIEANHTEAKRILAGFQGGLEELESLKKSVQGE